MSVGMAEPVQYTLSLSGKSVRLSEQLSKEIRIVFSGDIECVDCGKIVKKSYGQGFCYECFINSPWNSECIIRPELCRAHLGEGRDMEWEREHHLKPQIVYLALSSAVKVGITRETEIPTRWIDQGASRAVKVAQTPNRFIAGCVEVALKDYFTDKTNWRKMLKNEIKEETDLIIEKNNLVPKLEPEYRQYILEDNKITEIRYPVDRWPEKIVSLGLDKNPIFTGTLAGIKGQYLIFNDSRVFSVRRHSGYIVDFSINGT